MKQMGVGIVGCGNISGIYFENFTNMFQQVNIVACSDLDQERSAEKAEEFGCVALSTEELLERGDVDIVLNLTTPLQHTDVNLAALAAGKHVYLEKPLAIDLADARKVMEEAAKCGLRVGCAPDTFLGGGIQACRKLIEDGVIGEVTSAFAFMTCPGHERWHPDPEFYYQTGGGPMLDMGPYYLTALVNLVGPISHVSAITGKARDYRTITSEKKNGSKVEVEVPTHQSGSTRFANGAIGTVVMSFDVEQSATPRIEIHGTKGSISVPDPNTFGGPIYVTIQGQERVEVPIVTHSYTQNSRGIGLVDMAMGIAGERPHRATGELATHVLEAMLAFDKSSKSGTLVELAGACVQPAPLPVGLLTGELD